MPAINANWLELERPAECTTNFVAIVVYGTIEEKDGDGIAVRKANEGEEPHQWAVYGRCPDGTSEWVADFTNQLLAWFFTAHFAETLGVPVEEMMLNLNPLEAAVHMMNKKGVPN